MYREEQSDKKYKIMLHCGGLGDLLSHLPVIQYILDFHSHVHFDLWIHDYGIPLVQKIFQDYPQCNIRGISKIKEQESVFTRSPYIHALSNLAMHLTDHGFMSIVGTQVEDKYKNYIQLEPIDIFKFNLPKDYAIITTGFTSQTREWKPEYIKEVTDYLVSKRITPIYIGKSQTNTGFKHDIKGTFKADFSNGINLIDKTTILEAHGLISNARLAIGLDNGLCPHLAAMTRTPIVVGFTSVEPRHRLPYRNNILGGDCYVVTANKEKVECLGCQSNWNFADTNIDFKYCPYGDYKCVEQLISELWIQQIDKVLNNEC